MKIRIAAMILALIVGTGNQAVFAEDAASSATV